VPKSDSRDHPASDEAARYKDVPAVLDFHTNFYIFPVRLPAHGSNLGYFLT